ncbi:MAG: hypothetical protein Q4P33_09055, partial [Flaviflexus sp.]|nr:hypothetical protein [Flaviflexus sp.]
SLSKGDKHEDLVRLCRRFISILWKMLEVFFAHLGASHWLKLMFWFQTISSGCKKPVVVIILGGVGGRADWVLRRFPLRYRQSAALAELWVGYSFSSQRH